MSERPVPNFTIDELRASLGIPAVHENDPDAKTATEWAELMGVPENTMRRKIKAAVRAGAWVSVGPQRRQRGNGAGFWAEGYKPA